VRILVTGASGFVGTWLGRELLRAEHKFVGLPGADVLDIADRSGVADALAAARPEAVVHLAAMAYAPDAASAAAEAIRVNLGGTLAVLEACQSVTPRPALLVVGSSEVYGTPETDLPLTETSPLAPRDTYGLTKLAAEALALSAGFEGSLEVAVARSFNHTGPGQRPVFAVPAFASRILDARRSGVHEIRTGNIDVSRDIGDVRDVVRAYRLLTEALVQGRLPRDRRVYNVASGRAVSMRHVIDRLATLAGWSVTPVADTTLIRADDPPVIVGDASNLTRMTGWRPEFELDTTLADLLASLG
jgi:GDP-4-dehydro-6-deoxy-D-mannose reductase